MRVCWVWRYVQWTKSVCFLEGFSFGFRKNRWNEELMEDLTLVIDIGWSWRYENSMWSKLGSWRRDTSVRWHPAFQNTITKPVNEASVSKTIIKQTQNCSITKLGKFWEDPVQHGHLVEVEWPSLDASSEPFPDQRARARERNSNGYWLTCRFAATVSTVILVHRAQLDRKQIARGPSNA